MMKMSFLISGLMLMSLSKEFMFYFMYLMVLSNSWLFMYNSNVTSHSFLGSDILSWFMILLTIWIILLMLLSSHDYKVSNYYYQKFCFILILMLTLLFFTFSTTDLFSFYIFFEGSLIPIYLLIMGWGYQPERLQAGIYLLLYTIFASLPLLISIFFTSKLVGGFSFSLLNQMFDTPFWISFWFFFSIFAFLVKLPAFYVHLWLPKAHVEAPVSGSMMLAGVLLKLGCYGMMRFMGFFQGKVVFFSSLLVSLGLLGGLAVSLICLRQVDLKALIAYSSVSHMGLASRGLGSWGLWGFSSCLYTCVAHGLCSSGLFFLSGVIYERSSSRSLLMLACVLLKLGCYGMMRFMGFFQGKVVFFSSLLVSLGLLGGLAVSLICLRQVDLKALIAYSSVSHMGLASGGLGSWGLWGFSSCLYTCVAHGLCSSGLFFLSGVIYERSSSRSILINKGLLEIMPSLAFWWFIYCIGNMAAPVVLNLVGELGLLGSILSFNFYTITLLMMFSFLGACYSLYLFSSTQHGMHFMGVRALSDGMIREYLILFLHFFPLFFLILEVDFMTY
uniref:NADH-ubiquinone oxidoreductase chain 4 n=1 Tax=Megabalanus ajax TaxID=1325305 RepID=A0A0U1W4L7_9CRUS|nr:NADH dehydrogenase subunit 4 [Megabalanus ajax]AGZ19745.1 NADH dehydrogenase subunit 4 [Megabalanus ajax]